MRRELKLSFDRIDASVAMLEGATPIKQSCVGKPLQIKDCVAITEYIKSDSLEKHFEKIDFNPIPYYYQDCEVPEVNSTAKVNFVLEVFPT